MPESPSTRSTAGTSHTGRRLKVEAGGHASQSTGKIGLLLWVWLPDSWSSLAHPPRDEGTRIISMRKGNRREQKIYRERLGTDRPHARSRCRSEERRVG